MRRLGLITRLVSGKTNMQPKYTLNEEVHTVEPIRYGNESTLKIDGRAVTAQLITLDDHRGELVVNGVRREVFFAQEGGNLFVHMDGCTWQLEAIDEFSGSSGDDVEASGAVKASMPGVVLDLSVKEGDEVASGQSLMLIESMKLQTEITAPVSGKVVTVNVEPGQPFEKTTILVDIEVEQESE